MSTSAQYNKKKDGKGGVYISLQSKEGYALSFNFEEDGTPRVLKFRESKDKPFRFMYAFDSHVIGGDMISLRKENPTFAKMFDVMVKAHKDFENREQRMRDAMEEDRREELEAMRSSASRKEAAPQEKAVHQNDVDIETVISIANEIVGLEAVTADMLVNEYHLTTDEAKAVLDKLEESGAVTKDGNEYKMNLTPRALSEWKIEVMADSGKSTLFGDMDKE